MSAEEKPEAPRLDDLFKFRPRPPGPLRRGRRAGHRRQRRLAQPLPVGRIEYLRYLSLVMEGGRSPVQVVVRRSVLD